MSVGAVEFQDGLECDFANALLDGKLLLAVVLFPVLAGAKLPDKLKVRSLLQRRSESRQSSKYDGAMPVGAGFVIALVVLPGALGGE